MTKIIVIEDDNAELDKLVDWLQLAEYEVMGASNGQLGLEAIQQELPDMIVCDILMPEMDGHEVLIEVRSDPILNHIPFIFLTQVKDRDSVRKGMNLGADDYITKPVTRMELLNAIKARLSKQSVQNEQTKSMLNILNQTFSEEREKRLVKSRMIAMFSHDFRNPLSAVLMSSHIIRTYSARISEERKLQHLDRIDGAVHLLIQMLDDMMMVAEMEEGHLDYAPQPINLTELVETITEEFRLIDQNAHQLTLNTHAQLTLQADPKLLRQIIANLLSNAIKYSPVASEVIVSLSKSKDNSKVILSVKDHGIGIPEKNLSSLFDPFFRGSNVKNVPGTGLGLNIVNDCVSRHHGEITVASEIGIGSTFVVELPDIRAE